jgi:6-phospho-beta-glucosidase
MVVAVVGGATPFLSGLLTGLAGAGRPGGGPIWDLRLLGRDPRSLAVMEAHGRRVLGPPHSVTSTADPAIALTGSDVVLVQPRVGGLEGRAADEALADSVGAPADEGLGPGGLRAALRTAPVLRGLAADVRGRAPSALLVGFTNPLSSTVSVLRGAGATCVGVCELPTATAIEIAGRLGVPPERLGWSYTGLSHRGFVHSLGLAPGDGDGGRDSGPEHELVLSSLTAALRTGSRRDVGGIDVEVIEQLGAVPLKYHALLAGLDRPRAGRARLLADLRSRALDQLESDPGGAPRALRERSMPWFRLAVVPLLHALAGTPGADPRRHVLDVPCTDGLVRELHCVVDECGIAPAENTADGLTAPARRWLARYDAHERAVDALLAEPTPEHLTAVLEADPATPAAAAGAVHDRLLPLVRALADQPVAKTWWRA